MASLTGNLILIACLPVKCAVELTEPEKKALQQLSRKHPHQDFRTRGLGLLELASSRRVHEIAIELEVSDKSVYNWAVRHEVVCRRCSLANRGDHPCPRANRLV